MEGPQTLPIWIATMLLLLVANTIASKPSGDPFGFIKNLEGCHKGESITGLKQLKGYLQKFGYIQANNLANNDEFDDVLEEAIKNYQHNYHLHPTGILDNSTASQMMKPRCGVADRVNVTTNTQHKTLHTLAHYSFFPGPRKWPAETTHLRYRFISSRVQVPGTENIRPICAKAFQKWAQVTHFTFEEVSESSEAELEIGFFERFHGDDYPFDGTKGTLAHASAPTSGKCHFDSDERWSQNPGPNEVDLESVAVHEIGHLLGLDHSEDRNAIMFAYFGYGITKRELATDDIQGIRALYGLQ
ncbi:metalloendoproteinase 5-MMP-like [Euphorbia lathyris]|uniref:metalloendoproteinase 5-MMP-like n=1 Tax=Euphorbia lathyris TaxID=212925 RepID=UPI0033132CC7